MQTREVSPLTSCDQQFTPTQQVVCPQLPPTRLARSSARGWTAWVRLIALLGALAVGLVAGAPARAGEMRLDWPLRPPPAVTRGFDAPTPDWLPGHRGVDLAGSPGQPVYAAGDGTVVFAGSLAGRPVVSVAHPGGLHTSYEPVRAAVRTGQAVTAGTAVGELLAGHAGCPAAACLHWGAMWGPASGARYVDPLGLLGSTPIRLKPLRPRGRMCPGRHRGTSRGG